MPSIEKRGRTWCAALLLPGLLLAADTPLPVPLDAVFARPEQGRVLYRIGGRAYQYDAAAEEYTVSIRHNPSLGEKEKERLLKDREGREFFLETRMLGDLCLQELVVSRLADSPEFRAYLRVSVREAARHYLLSRRIPPVTVSDAEIEAFYNEHRARFAHLAFQRAREVAERSLELEKRRTAAAAWLSELRGQRLTVVSSNF
jgi:hypothetical protein